MLGFKLAWGKGHHVDVHADAVLRDAQYLVHEWIGIKFMLRGGLVVMGLTEQFVDDFRQVLLPFLPSRGAAPLKAARSLVGKASRVAQVVPLATPFAGALWAALTGALKARDAGKAEAPPGMVPTQRFFVAANWFLALLEPERDAPVALSEDQVKEVRFPLERLVFREEDRHRRPTSTYHVEFDASPWGGGAVLRRGTFNCAYFAMTWDDTVLSLFGAKIGDPKFQSLWEFITLLVAAIVWRAHARETTLFVLGDNIAALQDAVKFKGRGPMLTVARELAWRTARWPLHLDFTHLPKENNVLADALSRWGGVPACSLPRALQAAPRCEPWSEVWRAWEAGRLGPPARAGQPPGNIGEGSPRPGGIA